MYEIYQRAVRSVMFNWKYNHLATKTMTHQIVLCILYKENVCILYWQMVLTIPMGNQTILQTCHAKNSNNSLQNHKNTNRVQV